MNIYILKNWNQKETFKKLKYLSEKFENICIFNIFGLECCLYPWMPC